MRFIELPRDKSAVLDDDDFERLSIYHWCYRAERSGAAGYAIRHDKVGKKQKTVYMHREIMNPEPGFEVIFLNGDRLDCRRKNLRVVSKSEARRRHKAARSNSESGIKGVKFNPAYGTWTACIYRNNHYYSLGTFDTQQKAIDAYEAEIRRENPDLADAPPIIERGNGRTNGCNDDENRTNVQE